MDKKLEKEIWRIINKYKSILLLDRYTITLEHKTKNSQAAAEVLTNYPYLDVTIYYSDYVKTIYKKEDITPIIVHELCHIVVEPLYRKSLERFVSTNELDNERETLTDYIAAILLKNEK